jgi:hypothetical protein
MNDQLQKTWAALRNAKVMTQDRLSRYPKYGPYVHADEQISLIESILLSSTPPTEQQKESIDLGIMAIKALDAEEPDYSEALCELDFQFKKI